MGKYYGEKIPYDPLWKGPIEVSRSKTDPAALKYFFLFLLSWIVLGFYAYCIEEVKNGNRNKRAVSEDNFDWDSFQSAISDYKFLLISCIVISGILSLLFISSLKKAAKMIFYVAIYLFWFFMLCVIVKCFQEMEKSKEYKDVMMIPLVVFIGIFVVSVILVVVFRKKISTACGIIKEASKTVMYFPSHFLIPILTSPLSIMVFSYFGYITWKLSVANYNTEYKSSSFYNILYFYNFAGLLLVWNFVSGIETMIFSSSFSTWYWTMNKDYVPRNTVSNSVNTVSRYHLGTVAFGSMVLTVCRVIQAILNSIMNTGSENDDNGARCLKSIFSCCCESIMDVIEYINRNAYVMSSIHGTDFLTSAKNVFNLIKRNLGKVVVTTQVTGMVFSLGILIAILVPYGLAFWQVHHAYNLKVSSAAALIILFPCIIVSNSIFSILQTGIDTIFICTIEDYERNDGSDARPYYMNPKLRNLLLNE